MPKSKPRNFIVAMGGAILAAVLVGSFLLPTPSPIPVASTPLTATASSAVQADRIPDVFLGVETAPVTLIEYGSYTCVHCGHFAENVLPVIEQDYIETGKVRFALREAFLDRPGIWAGLLAHHGSDNRADAERFYALSHELFRTQGHWAFEAQGAEQVAERLRATAASAGMSQEQIDAAFADGALAERLVKSFTAYSTEDGIQATPTFLINGVKHSNMPLEEFREVLDAAIADATR